jgi:hypothetical protein
MTGQFHRPFQQRETTTCGLLFARSGGPYVQEESKGFINDLSISGIKISPKLAKRM